MTQPKRSRKRDKPTFPSEPELIVVVEPTAGFRAAGETVTAAAADAEAVGGVLSEYSARIQPLFGPSEDRVLATSGGAAVGVPTPDLTTYYRVTADEERLEDLAGALADRDGVVGAYVKPPAEPAVALDALNEMTPSEEALPPTTPDFTSRQGYLGPASEGIDAQFAWTRPGGRGAGVRIIDVEGAWRFDHEDLLANASGALGTQSTDIGWRNHGTAVQGEFGGDVNAFGITGICSDADIRGFSIFGGLGSAAAIHNAATALSPGDIILIELHRPGPGASGAGQDGFIAMEWWPDDFDAILFATGTRGVVVVEAAGNGARNLDDPIYNTPDTGFPSTWRNPFNRSLRDSGAILVGAGAPPPGTHGRDWGPDRSRLDFSNHGSAVDAQGWGREVTSTGYGDLQGGTDERTWYTDQFSGTSSASPIVVGACGCTQGNRRARGLAPFTSLQMRAQLRATGSPQQDAPGRPASQRIGNRPNLRQLIGPAKPLKEHKLEKLEKPEKLEKREKLEKNEKVEKREKFEKLEGHEKFLKPEKREKPEKLEFERGSWPQSPSATFAGGELEERVAALENAIAELTHFIGPELRPDLSGGALSGEEDAEQWYGADPGGPTKLVEGP
jgi:Subtilase family